MQNVLLRVSLTGFTLKSQGSSADFSVVEDADVTKELQLPVPGSDAPTPV